MTGLRRPSRFAVLSPASLSQPTLGFEPTAYRRVAKTLRRAFVAGAFVAWASASGLATVAAATTLQDDAAPVSEVRSTFDAGVAALNRGDDEAALDAFKRVLALDPSQGDAYDLWQATDHRIWLDLLARRGQFELVASRLLDLTAAERGEVSRDADAIRELLTGLEDADPIERRQRIASLRANHGEFAVPFMLAAVADEGDDDRRVSAMVSLADLGEQAVPPLLAALDSPNPVLRRNIALVLGRSGDQRAAGALAGLLETDPNQGVRDAAQSALVELGATGGQDALGLLLQQGSDYLNGRLNVLGPGLSSPVVWSWNAGRLESTDVPASAYAEEMAKQTYMRALAVDPTSPEVLGGIARSAARQAVELEADPDAAEALAGMTDSGLLGASLVSAEALESALNTALADSDLAGAVGLVRLLGDSSEGVGDGLRAAIGSRFPLVRDEGAIAAVSAALSSGQEVPERVIEVLGSAAARQVQRTALVVDPNGARAEQLNQALGDRGAYVQRYARGLRGLVGLRQVPGIDMILIADELPDITIDQALESISEARQAENAPVFVLSSDPDTAAELYGERVAGVISADGGMELIEEALQGSMNRDRAEAERLAGEAAAALAQAGRAGTSLAVAADDLAGALAGRTDEVTIAALNALEVGGSARHAGALLAVFGDAERSVEAREAAADALSGVFRRDSVVGDESLFTALESVITDAESESSLRRAAGRALAAMQLDPEARAAVLRATRPQAVTE